MREELGDLAVFLAVAEESSFTRASVRLGLSQPAVSHSVRRLEESVGLKLLNRTSRKVSTTEAGEKLLDTLRPSFSQINARIEEIRMLGDAPRGLVRLTASKTAARTILWPKVSQILKDYPEVQIEINLESRLSDITEDRFDAAVRLREFVSPDMIAVRIGPQIRMVAVASPDYFRTHGVPEHPEDLDSHACLAMRFSPTAPPYDWEFEKGGEVIVKKVHGSLICSDSDMCIEAAREGHGIVFVTEPEVLADIQEGKLRRVLADWCPPFDGFHLCYSGRRQMSSAFRLVVDRLRYRD
ncbi:LysR family transcriptional regulator [Marinobacter salinexigens]|uniref:LysR family transcriptional regulator n=1 Tax=Marinobacter salinexigens TaxID=2919747 RepID=A0A5B0VIM5_9GAMM|nr:LysR family transcriptional regulator [Marinobacter salinexigens]KAA1173985.1 LysR family transcriptional regulator [Marinobacter salinexigens]